MALPNVVDDGGLPGSTDAEQIEGGATEAEQAKTTANENALKDLEDAGPTVAEGNGPLQASEDLAQAVIAFDQRGHIRLAFDKNDEAYDISALQQENQDITRPGTTSCPEVQTNVPAMAICIMIVGTRGDVQPFIGIAKRLQQDGHRVRLATHAVYRDFVTEHGVEFYPLGGDPKELAAYMVKTGGHLIPLDYKTITKDVPRNMQMIDEILHSTWPAVSAPDPDALGKGVPGQPFQAQAIISNPVTYGHIHVAERLGVPLHIMFPQPWVPTVAFPHPLSNMPYDDKPQKRNYMSYKLVDLLMWQGTESIVNQFRTQVLGLRKIRKGDGGRDMLLDMAIPHAFMWSPALVPKPADWGDIYDVIGTVLLKEAGSKYAPTPELEAFLGNDGGPIFVGFGSMIIADPKATTTMIIEAARLANVRVLIQSSWSDMAAGIDVPDNIFFIGNCPHDWLMPRVSAVVHHGGAGTTAAGLLAGKPTFIVPFFGDQPFWGRAVVRAGVGVEPCPIAKLSVEKLHQAFVGLQTPEIRARALALRDVMNAEDGVEEAVKCFYRHLPVKVMVCELCEKNAATKWSEKDKVRMCTLCETVTIARPGNSSNHIRHYQSVDLLSHGPNSTLTGLTSGTSAFLHELGSGVKDIFIKPAQGFRKGGATGAVIGLTKGLVSCVLIRPIHGVVIFADHIATGHHNAHRGPTGRKVGSLWMDNKKLRKWAGYKTAPVAHTSTMKPDDRLRQKMLPEFGTVAVSLSTEEWRTMTMKVQALLAATNTLEHSATAAATALFTTVEQRTIPKMSITMLTTGTWSENIQPFVAIGLRLQADGHFVRIATNECYRTRIVGKGLNFFPLGGESTTIASYLLYCNELSKQKRKLFSFARSHFPALNELRDFVFSLWPACVGQEPAYRGLNYRADLIISHPLMFGHSIVAERLGVPLHCISETPLSHTKAFPHLRNSQDTCSFPYKYLQANAVTHTVADKLLWKGMRHILDSFRTYVGLSGTTNRHNILRKWRIPHSYLWNADLLPKPTDWGQEISIAGFIDVDDANEDGIDTNHANAPLLNQLNEYVSSASTPIMYFGLAQGDWEPLRIKRLLHEIEEAATSTNVRVIFQTDVESEIETLYQSPAVFEVPAAIPTKLLVPFVAGAVHWGSSSVVASWLKAGIPSCVAARDATQRMWGQAIAHAGVGAEPLDTEALSSARLASAFVRLLDASVVENARQMSQSFSSEVAIEKVVEHLYSSLPVEAMQCDVDPTRVARMYDPVRELKLSYEGRLIVQSVFHEDGNEPKVPSTIKYKPLKYTLRHAPKVSLRQLRKRGRSTKAAQVVYDGDKRGKPSRLRVTMNNFSLARHGVRPLEKSLVLDVVDAPPNWPTFDAWPAHVSRIDASYEKIVRERLMKK